MEQLEGEVEELRRRCDNMSKDIASREEQLHQYHLNTAELERTIKFKDQEVRVCIVLCTIIHCIHCVHCIRLCRAFTL